MAYTTLDKIEDIEIARIDTGIEEINRIYGNGLPVGTWSMWAGEKGVGKSRTCLKVIEHVIRNGGTVAVAQMEAQLAMFKKWVDVSGLDLSRFYITNERDPKAIAQMIRETRPTIAVIDSVNMLDGNRSQIAVRETCDLFEDVAYEAQTHIIAIGQLVDGKVKGSSDWVFLPSVVCLLENWKPNKQKLASTRKKIAPEMRGLFDNLMDEEIVRRKSVFNFTIDKNRFATGQESAKGAKASLKHTNTGVIQFASSEIDLAVA